MANTLGSLNGALILQEALSLTFTKRPLLKMISKGFTELDGSVQNALLGQSVTSRIKTVQTVNAFGTGAGNIVDTDVNVSLSAMKEIHVAITPAQYNATNRDIIAEAAEPIAVALGNHIVDSVADLWTVGTYGAGISAAAAAWTYAGLVLPIRNAMANAGISEANRFCVLNSAAYGALLADKDIVAALNNPMNLNAIAEGRLPKIAGIQFDEYAALSANATGATTDKRIGFAGNPESTVFVARAPKAPSEVGAASFPGTIDFVQDPTTGFRVMVNQWVDPSTLVYNNRLVWLQGFAVGNATQGLVVRNTI